MTLNSGTPYWTTSHQWQPLQAYDDVLRCQEEE